MDGKNRNEEIIKNLLDIDLSESIMMGIKGFGYYLSSRKEHLYNLGYYMDEEVHYRNKVADLQGKYALCEKICRFVNKRFVKCEKLKRLLPMLIIFDEIFVYEIKELDIDGVCRVNTDKSIENFIIHNIDTEHIVLKIVFGENYDNDSPYTQQILYKINNSDLTNNSIESKRRLIRFIQYLKKKNTEKR